MRSLKVLAWPAIAAILALALAGCGGQQTASPAPSATTTKIMETGSTLLWPLFNKWVPAYQKANHGVQITTAGTGSGAGIDGAIKGTAQIGASDAYLTTTQAQANPTLMNIPLGISVQQINFNVPGLNKTNLKLSGPVLAGIYSGTIRYWDASALKALNPGVNLPHQAIIPVHRSDGSGDTFIFSQYLSFSNPNGWGGSNGPGYGTTITWPAVSNAVGAQGNPGMVQALSTPYSIAYVGISWLDQINAAGYGTAALLNKNGNFVLPTKANAATAAATMVGQTPANETLSMVFAPGANSYPIINYEYAIVNQKQPSAATATAIKHFLDWCINPANGNSSQYLDAVHFLPLPSTVSKLSADQIAKIGS